MIFGKIIKNGILIYEKNCIENKYLNILDKLFDKKIPVSKKDDLLILI